MILAVSLSSRIASSGILIHSFTVYIFRAYL